jgi:hypothetical protein
MRGARALFAANLIVAGLVTATQELHRWRHGVIEPIA